MAFELIFKRDDLVTGRGKSKVLEEFLLGISEGILLKMFCIIIIALL
jgi:hypothetical protein